MKKKARQKKSDARSKNGKLEVINLKITAADRRKILAQARKHAKGNLSAWLRFAGLEYVPPRQIAVPLKVYK